MSIRIVVSNKCYLNFAKNIVSTTNILKQKYNIKAYIVMFGDNVSEHTTITIYVDKIQQLPRNIKLYPSDFTFFMPNFMTFTKYDERMLRYVDVVLCRSIYERKVMEIIKSQNNFTYCTYYIRNVSAQCNDISSYMKIKSPTIKKKNPNLWYHLPDDANYFGTKALIDVWVSENGFKKLNKSLQLIITRYPLTDKHVKNDLDSFLSKNPVAIKKIFNIPISGYKLNNLIVITRKPSKKLYDYVRKNGQVAIATSLISNNDNQLLFGGLCDKSYIITSDLQLNLEIVNKKNATIVPVERSVRYKSPDIYSSDMISIYTYKINKKKYTQIIKKLIKKTNNSVYEQSKKSYDAYWYNNVRFNINMQKLLLYVGVVYDNKKGIYNQDLKYIWHNVYKYRIWNYWTNKYPVWGRGSYLPNTIVIQKELIKFIKKNKIKSMCDIGCAPITWMMNVIEKTNIKYLGMDINEDYIKMNKKKIKNHKFMVGDCTKIIPKGYDLYFARFVHSHMSYKSFYKFINQLPKKGILLLTLGYKKEHMLIESGELLNHDGDYINQLRKHDTQIKDYCDNQNQVTMLSWKLPVCLINKPSTFSKSESVFNTIYKTKYWKRNKSDDDSGNGSTIKATVETVKIITKIIEQYKIKSMYDTSCGTMNWITKVLDKTKIKYIGADISSFIINKNKNNSKLSKYTLIVNDITTGKIPKCDLILCRDVLQHLSIKQIHAALKNISSSKCKYLLVSNYIQQKTNDTKIDILCGDANERNLFNPPFNLKGGQTFNEHYKGKYLTLFKLPLNNY